eukprot:TRINITY_DN3998_c0_g1_i1.p1 TRINITY_DN3998_c0_g1~~TRINITY_DN3998_c0_g1_i1.p1  ORF type:complete len:174 (-),score=12.32 TRINITY_DN3998_c0_g1_i1:95-616(-)
MRYSSQALSASLNIGGISHVVIDEVHERSIEIDILLKILKDPLVKRKDLKIVLMSATLNAETFSSYFGGAPVVSIPGRTFPVEEFFLENILCMVPNFNLKRATWIKRTRDEETMRKDIFENKYRLPPEAATQLARYDEGDKHQVDLDMVFLVVRHIIRTMGEGAYLNFHAGDL